MTKEFLDRLEAGLARLIDELEATKNKMKAVEAEADGLRIHAADRDRIEARNQELEAQVQELSPMREENEELRAEIENLHHKLETAQATAGRVPELEAESVAVRKRVGELEHEGVELRRHRDEQDAELQARAGRIEEVEQWQRDTVAHRDQVVKELEEAHAKYSRLDTTYQEVCQECDRLRAEKETRGSDLEGRLQAVSAERDAATESVDQLKANILTLVEERNEACEGKVRMARDMEELQQKLKSSLEREKTTGERLSGLIARIEKTESILGGMELVSHG